MSPFSSCLCEANKENIYGQPTILVLDDDPCNLQYLNALLSDDYEVITTLDAFEAVSLSAQKRPDLVITDLLMPEISGHGVCQLLKVDGYTKDIPILYLTSSHDEVDELRALERGGNDFVTRPVNPAILKARVRNLIRARRHELLLTQYALYDELTALPNRRYLHERAEQEWRACQREKAPFSVMLLDIDYFKQYNDHYGHSEGDECLHKVAGILKSSLRRPRDFAARLGGEEFIAILPETPHIGAAVAAERARKAIENAMIPHSKSAISDHITVSIGFACDPTSSSWGSFEKLTKQADEFLYSSKGQGRNSCYSITPTAN